MTFSMATNLRKCRTPLPTLFHVSPLNREYPGIGYLVRSICIQYSVVGETYHTVDREGLCNMLKFHYSERKTPRVNVLLFLIEVEYWLK